MTHPTREEIESSVVGALQKALPGAHIEVLHASDFGTESVLQSDLPLKVKALLINRALTHEMDRISELIRAREELLGLNGDDSPLTKRLQAEVNKMEATRDSITEMDGPAAIEHTLQLQFDLVHDLFRMLAEMRQPTAAEALGS